MRIAIAKLTFSTLWFLSAILPTSSVSAQLTYSVTDLGALDGGTSSASDINDLGQVVGSSFVNSLPKAYLWQNGSMVQLPGLDVDGRSFASEINNLGQVAGSASDFFGDSKAVLWENGALLDLGDLANNDSISLNAKGLNDLTQIVGDATAPAAGRAFYWESGTMTELSGTASVNAINNAGQIVGSDSDTGRGLLFNGTNGIVILSDFANGIGFNSASDINSSGEIVGIGFTSVGRRAAFWSDPTTIVDLGDLAGGNDSSIASAINDDGLVVGSSSVASGDHAFVWSQGMGMLDLNDLLDSSGDNWILTRATGINAPGQIVGTGVNPDGVQRAFLLTAVPCLLGDIDLNGTVEFLDIQPFIAILSGGPFQCEADINLDGTVTFLDIQPFIALLAGQ